jgi:hypothetical protein
MRLLRLAPLVAFVFITLGALVLAQQAGDDSSRATEFFNKISAAPYTDWSFQPNVPAGYYVGIEPHGMILRTFMNDIALQDTQGNGTSYSEGAIIVKENHMPGETDISQMEAQAPVEGFNGNLAALTFMVKVPGYNPEAGDWFWASAAPDGTINDAGKVEMCAACHSQAADRDFVFNVGPGGN